MSPAAARKLNEQCFCVAVDQEALFHELDALANEHGFGRKLSLSHPHLFSKSSVFVASDDLAAMLETIHAIEAAVNTQHCRDTVLPAAPPIARTDPGTRGVFMGYDFHITPDGPRLIEVNTNAGGAFLKGRKQRAVPLCKPVASVLKAWLDELNPAHDENDLVFPSSRGGQLSADAVAQLLEKHVMAAAETCPSAIRQSQLLVFPATTGSR